jgi:hypothetical protein
MHAGLIKDPVPVSPRQLASATHQDVTESAVYFRAYHAIGGCRDLAEARRLLLQLANDSNAALIAAVEAELA